MVFLWCLTRPVGFVINIFKVFASQFMVFLWCLTRPVGFVINTFKVFASQFRVFRWCLSRPIGFVINIFKVFGTGSDQFYTELRQIASGLLRFLLVLQGPSRTVDQIFKRFASLITGGVASFAQPKVEKLHQLHRQEIRSVDDYIRQYQENPFVAQKLVKRVPRHLHLDFEHPFVLPKLGKMAKKHLRADRIQPFFVQKLWKTVQKHG